MNRKRKLQELLHHSMTRVSVLITCTILVLILSFLFQNGGRSLSLDMMTKNYWSENRWAVFPDGKLNSSMGIVFEDKVDFQGKEQLVVGEISQDSIFKTVTNGVAGPEHGLPISVETGNEIERIVYLDIDGHQKMAGKIVGDNAQTLTQKLSSAVVLMEVFYKTQGGGIWGSLLATLMLIGLTIVFAFPIGIATALYLNEVAAKGRMSQLMESSIDMLAGVPSIIFGLMGMVVLFPIVSLFNVSGMSIILGSLTMAVLLLPVIIRSVQESLKVVPVDQRLASLSLGATDSQTIMKVTLPAAMPGILSALLLAISRIIGESAALIFTMGTFINDNPKLTQGATSLSVHIWTLMSHEQPNFRLASAISIIILLMVLSLNVFIKILSHRLEKRFQ